MKKKRGAQPGNNNAVKHAIYTSANKLREAHLLDKLPVTDLSPEINFYRALTDRYLESLNVGTYPLDPETQLSAMRAISLAMNAISRFQRLNALALILNKDSDELKDKLLNPTVLRPNVPNTSKG